MKASWLIYSGVYSVLFFASNCHICISDKLRKRVTWNVCELGYLQYRSHYTTTFPFLESVLAYSPEGYFSDGEREIAKSILSKCPQFVELEVREPEIMPFAVKLNTMIAAVAHVGGTISVVCLLSLVELWQYSTEFKSISHCTFGPDGSFILFGRLGTVFDIAERKEVPYFCGNEETFTCCAFSPNGKRLVTSDGSDAVKLWDVAKQSLLTSLDAAVPVNSCTFSSSGLFIIAGKEAVYSFDEDEAEEADSFCTWSAITWQRSHGRTCMKRFLKSEWHYGVNHVIVVFGQQNRNQQENVMKGTKPCPWGPTMEWNVFLLWLQPVFDGHRNDTFHHYGCVGLGLFPLKNNSA